MDQIKKEEVQEHFGMETRERVGFTNGVQQRRKCVDGLNLGSNAYWRKLKVKCVPSTSPEQHGHGETLTTASINTRDV